MGVGLRVVRHGGGALGTSIQGQMASMYLHTGPDGLYVLPDGLYVLPGHYRPLYRRPDPLVGTVTPVEVSCLGGL